MNKILMIALLLLVLNEAHAQKPKIEFVTNPFVGYETNILQSPSRVNATDQNLTTSDLWINAPYLGVKNRLKIADQKKKNTVLLTANYRQAIITSDDDVVANDLYVASMYRYNHKKIKNEFQIDFRKYAKTGEDQDNLIGVPLSYNRLRISDEMNVKLSKKYVFQFIPNITIKHYQRDGFERFMYLEPGIQSNLLYRYNYKRKMGLGLFLDAHQRNFTIQKEMEDLFEDEELWEEEVEIDRRTWRYYSAGMGISIPIKGKMRLKLRSDYSHRSDVLQNKLGYNQYEMSLRFNYKGEKWKWNMNNSIQFRDYTDFSVSVGQDKKRIDYTYIRYGFGANYFIGGQFDMTFRADGKVRLSNVNQLSRTAFRSYVRGECSVGIQYTFKSKSRTRLK